MNQSPIKNSSLRDTIRCIEAYDPSLLPIKSIYENTYITKSDIDNFMHENDIHSPFTVLDTIQEMNNIKGNILIIDDDKEFSTLTELCSLLESLDAQHVMDVADGKQLSKMRIDKLAAFILRREYDDIGELTKYIEECDRLLKDIKEERKIADDMKRNSSYKFSARFFFIIIRSIFKSIIMPFIVKKQIVLPTPIAKLYTDAIEFLNSKLSKKSSNKPQTTPSGAPVIPSNHMEPFIKGYKIGRALGTTIIPNTVNLYLSFKDYNKLLDHYEAEITKVKIGLQAKRKAVLKTQSK